MPEKRIGLKSEYVRVNCYAEWFSKTMPDGFSYGGNQGWFDSRSDGSISPLGCGLISCADILLYKSGRTKLDKAEYLEFARSIGRGSLKVRKKLGINGISMAFGIRRRLRLAGAPFKARWCFSKKKILPRITDMLHRDIPVTIAAGPHLLFRRGKKTGVALYIRDKQGGFSLPDFRSGLVRDHYMTVTAVIETDEKTYLEVSSWGERYYIDWADYLSYIKTPGTFFSNIMYIR